ncbi:hypothetical protein FO519_008100 [Halicephalobus sp. NKZ332]|nr:hypothetical protein FO519_008100 [Halicephalobus sp. NKZ332]
MQYVENGVVNAYSTKFPYRVGTNISHLIFSWNTSELQKPVRYAINAVADKFDVLPVVNLPAQGVIPTETENFAVEYRCVGSRSDKFLVTLYFNISWPSENKTTAFTLKQEKLCAGRDGRRILDEEKVAIDMPSRLGLTKEASLFDSPTRPFIEPLTSTPNPSKFLPTKLPIFTASLPSKAPPIIFERAQNHLDINNALIELSADRNLFQVIPGCELEGTFGEVKWAIWRQNRLGICGDIDDEEDGASEDIAVVCKTLKSTADKAHFQQFIKDALIFHNVPAHPNLAQVIGAATYGNFSNPETVSDFPLITYRHQGFGNLKKFLIQCRSSSEGSSSASKSKQGASHTLRTHELLSMAIQILKAVQHLHKYGIIHKDVSTRNCLVSEIAPKLSNDRLYVQLCDSALSKDLFPNDYHCLGDNDNRPIKWLAPETIKSKVHNSASDIWSFGVAMWELFTCAQQPYFEIEPEEVQAELEQGVRLGQPYNCPDELYGAMYCCWNREALKRPTTGQLLKLLEDFNAELKKYI